MPRNVTLQKAPQTKAPCTEAYSQALICAHTAAVEMPYRSCSVGSAPASRSASGKAICRKVGVTPLRRSNPATASPSPPIIELFSAVTTKRPDFRASAKMVCSSSGLMLGTCSTATATKLSRLFCVLAVSVGQGSLDEANGTLHSLLTFWQHGGVEVPGVEHRWPYF